MFVLASVDGFDKTLKTSISFEGDKCQVIISGGLDWTKDSEVVTECLNKVWARKNITYLELDFRDLFFTGPGVILGTYFLAVILLLQETAEKRNVKLFIRLKSREQVAILDLWGGKMWQKFKGNFLFDNPD